MREAPSVARILGFSCVVLIAATASANEGQWTPDQIEKLDQKQLASLGLELTPAQLWDPAGDERTGGLMRAAVNFGGCSAAFISPDGLIATNHHCAYGALQSNSTPEHDYIKQGFLAKDSASELEAKGKTIKVLRSVSDVSPQIRTKADAENSDRARAKLIEAAQKKMVKECEAKSSDLSCHVASFYNGSEYRLFEYLELRDVRVVYAPPAAVGEYGGEVDNWMWPRHTGDFSMVRAYVGPDGTSADPAPENVPYKPGQYLQVSTEGVDEGSFVAVLGYPGRTRRYMSAPDVQRWIEQVLPFKVDLYGEWIGILEELGGDDPAVAIKVAATKKGLANGFKNARGMLDGLDHMQLLEERRTEERKLSEWAAGKPEYAGVLEELAKLSAEQQHGHERGVLLDNLGRGPKTLAIGIDLVRNARAAALPDLERPRGYMERDQKRLQKRQESRVRDFDDRVDIAMLASFLARNQSLDSKQRIEPLSKLARKAASAKTREEFGELAKSQVAASTLHDPKVLAEQWKGATPEQLATSEDPMLVLANAIVDVLEEKEEKALELQGALARLRPKYFDMLEAVRKGPIYPDANGTLRFSYATVKPYDKWDGQPQVPQTVLAGAIAKHTGETPFDVPQKVRDRASEGPKSAWADAQLGDVPLCFLSDADTTGGNSGSPVIDGKGRLVGFNFDRVWENIAGDFNYFAAHSRNISADARYLLWMLEEVDGASGLLAEMGVSAKQVAADAPNVAATDAAAQDKQANVAAGGCGCRTEDSPGRSGWVMAAFALFALGRRRA